MTKQADLANPDMRIGEVAKRMREDDVGARHPDGARGRSKSHSATLRPSAPMLQSKETSMIDQKRSPARERAVPDKKFTAADPAEGRDPRNQPARPDPRTGEVPAGPGDAGLSDRPEANAGSPGTKQMSNRRLGIGLGIAALLSILAFFFAGLF